MAQLIDQVVGHQQVWESLLHLVELNKLPSGMAFVGPTGVGKSLVARAFAEHLECHSDLLWIEPSSEVIKVEQIHEMLKRLSLRTLSRYRLVVIDQAEKLNAQSSNALLKALEEPPENTHFILITNGLGQLLPTIRSRVQSFRFYSLTLEDLKKIAPEAPDWVLRLSRGQVSEIEEWQGEELTQLLERAENACHSLGQKDVLGWVEILSQIKDRKQALRVAKILQYLFKDLSQTLSETEQTLPFSKKLRSSFDLGEAQLTNAWQKAFDLESNIIHNGDRSLLFQNYFYEIHSKDLRNSR